MSNAINHDRRRFLGTAAMAVVGTRLGMLDAESRFLYARPAVATGTKRKTASSFGPLKRIDAGLLNVGYAEEGASDGSPIVLLHGWPYDIHSYLDAAPLLATAGYRMIIPYLRGYGMTRFLSASTSRNAQQSALAVDVIALMDALGIEKAIIAGLIGEQGPPTSSRRSGRSGAEPSSP